MRNGGQCPTAGGRSYVFWLRFMVTHTCNEYWVCNVEKARADRGGRALPGGAARLDSG